MTFTVTAQTKGFDATFPNDPSENLVEPQHEKITRFLQDYKGFSKELDFEYPSKKKLKFRITRNESPLIDQPSYNELQNITNLIENQNIEELKEIFSESWNYLDFEKLKNILLNFSNFNLLNNIQKILEISDSRFYSKDIRSYLIASLINRDKIALKDINLCKSQIKQIGPLLTYLDCKNSFDISWSKNDIQTFLDSCIHLRALKINTDKITKLPKLDFCEILDCAWCEKLTELPNLPECRELYCHSCKKLSSLPNLEFCEILDCSECPNLKTLPMLEQCKILRLKSCTSLTSLPELKSCEIVDCSQCVNLKNIDSLPSCKELYCNVCTNLLNIADLPSLKIFNCSRCTKLNRLPAMPLCEEIECSKCTSLTEIPSLLNLRELRCTGCTNIWHIATLPSCQELYCSNCTRLIELSFLPSCRIIVCNNCNALNRNTIPTQNNSILTIKIENLNNDPLGVVLDLEIPLIRDRLLPTIRFVEPDGRIAAGVDAGGGLRVFIAKLIASLISHLEEAKQLKFVKNNDSNLYLPFLDQRDIDIQVRGFKILGALFELCYYKALSGQSTTTGIYFDRSIFEIITAFSIEDLSEIDINKENLDIQRDIIEKLSSSTKIKLMTLLSKDDSKKILRLLEIPFPQLKSEEFEILREFVITNIDSEQEKVPANLYKKNLFLENENELKSYVQAYVRKFYLDHLPDTNLFVPSLIITKQMQQLIGTSDAYDRLRTIGAASLDHLIQGVIDRDSFKKALIFNFEKRKIEKKKIDDTIKYLNDWIDQASLKELENLYIFITGSPTINPTKQLTVQLYDSSPIKLPTSHTCSFEFDLSVNYESYDTFKDKLETALANTSSKNSSSLEIQ